MKRLKQIKQSSEPVSDVTHQLIQTQVLRVINSAFSVSADDHLYNLKTIQLTYFL